MDAERSVRRNSRRGPGRWAWLPIPLLLVTMAVLWAVEPSTVYASPGLQMLLNFLTRTMATLFIVYLAGRVFLDSGAPGLLLMGSGVAVWGASGFVASSLASRDPNLGMTISNLGLWLSALCHLAGSLLTLRSKQTLRAKGLWLGMGLALVLGAVGLIALATSAGRLPIFFIQGHGGTLVRHIVLGSAVAMFVLTAVLLWSGRRPSLSAFTYWYILALLLMATGSAGLVFEASANSMLDWACRSAQYLSGVYLLVAAMASKRGPGRREITLAQALNEARYRYAVAIVAVLAGVTLRLVFLQPLGTRATFVTLYPAVMLAALYGGLRAGLLATILSAIMADYLWIGSLGFGSGDWGDWLAMGVFLVGCTMISGIAEGMHRAQARARESEAEARFADERRRAAEIQRDDEERRKVAQAVQAERQRLNDVLELLPAYVVLLSPDYHVPFANRFFRERYGESRGKRCFEYLFNRTAPCEICETYRVMQTHVPHTWEWTGPDGRDYDVYDFPFTDADGSPLIMEMGIDVTERKRVERELLQRSEQLARMASNLTLAEQRERRRLAQLLHDGLQQVLAVAKLRVDKMVRGGKGDVSEAATEVRDLIREAIKMSRSLTAELSPPILHEGGLIAGLEWLAGWMQSKHELRVELDVQGAVETPPDMTMLLFQAVRELLFNIAKHAKVQTAQVHVSARDHQLRIAVVDKGVGFDPQPLHGEGGHADGFGLFSIRERLSLLGGSLEIDSRPGQGSRCTLTVPLPALPGAAEATPFEAGSGLPVHAAAPPEEGSAPERISRVRILVVDDHAVMREGLSSFLGEEPDMEVVGAASDGESALRLVREIRPDVVLMDFSMPGMNGLEATRILHAEMPGVQIIGLSMYEEAECAAAMRQAGAVAYLTKSGPAEELIAAIRACVPPGTKFGA